MTVVIEDPEVRQRILMWHRERFPDALSEHVFLKLTEELGEAASAYSGLLPDDVSKGRGNPPAELADIVINVIVLEERWPGFFRGVSEEVLKKIAVLEDRSSDHRSSLGGMG